MNLKPFFVMQVTNDDEELPVTPPMHQRELERFLGLSKGTISHFLNRNQNHRYHKRRKYKYVRIDFEEYEDEQA